MVIRQQPPAWREPASDQLRNGAAFLVVADEQFGRQIPFAFLERVRAEFQEKFADKGRTATAHSLDNSVGWGAAALPAGPLLATRLHAGTQPAGQCTMGTWGNGGPG